MKFLTTVALALVSCTLVFATPLDLSRVGRQSIASIIELRERIAAVGGCNANVCFAIDGSESLTLPEFIAEKNFVLDLASIISVDSATELAAVQYGVSNSRISPLTADVDGFILKVDNELYQNAPETFLTGGINYCFSQLARRRGEALKMVVLGDGSNTIGSSAVGRANLFRRALGGEICTVGAGEKNDIGLRAIAGGNQDMVFEVRSFLDVLDLQAILERLVEGICNVKLD